ncbi:MAG: hypothetical protein WAM30_20800 [Candidatus Dormiibacterota bacterium]
MRLNNPAVIPPDRLLPGEDPETRDPLEAIRWHQAYNEMIQAKDSLIDDLARSIEMMGPDARAELTAADGVLLGEQRDRFRRRFAFWQLRQSELADGI